MESSLLGLVEPSMENLTQLDELFCRDTEPFSEFFEVDDQKNRPESCPPLGEECCAVLYDSANCSGGWQLNVTAGEQRSFSYFSGDWTYRNDADVLGVRHGCTFTGFTSAVLMATVSLSPQAIRTGGQCSRKVAHFQRFTRR